MKKIAVLLIFCLLFCQTAFATDTERRAQGKGVRIAIIDTGISTLTMDKERVAEGKNYIQPTEGTEDKIGHGTAIASLLLGRESRGLVGTSPKATLVPLVYCTLTEEGHIIKGDSTMLARCIREAVDIFGCRVINLSAGVLEDTQELRKAVSYVEDRGAVIVSAVGNDNRDYPARIYYPAAYDTVLGVGALNEKGQVASYSQRNSSVALCAPGDNLWVARASGKMTRVSGASYACAYVSAAAASLLSVYPSLTPKELRQILCSTALDIGAKGYDMDSGFGALNVDAALQYPVGGQRFSDVPRGVWYFDTVQTISELGLMSGTSPTEFSPNEVTSKAMILTILHRIAVAPQATQAEKPWYKTAQTWAVERGISDGNGMMEPITREELVTFMWRCTGEARLTKYEGLWSFRDASEISDFAIHAMEWAHESGIITGTSEKTLSPKGETTRAEAAVLLLRFNDLWATQ